MCFQVVICAIYQMFRKQSQEPHWLSLQQRFASVKSEDWQLVLIPVQDAASRVWSGCRAQRHVLASKSREREQQVCIATGSEGHRPFGSHFIHLSAISPQYSIKLLYTRLSRTWSSTIRWKKRQSGKLLGEDQVQCFCVNYCIIAIPDTTIFPPCQDK